MSKEDITPEQAAADNAKESEKQRQIYVVSAIMIAARAAHEVNRVYCQSLGDDSQLPWAEAPEWQRDSIITGVRAVIKDPRITLAQRHSMWMAYKKAEGWVYGEEKDAEKKTHPCMVPFEELSSERQFKDTLFSTTVRAVLGITG